jgi:photosystem II stability/assembly factor-like uncharacterized protein
MKTAFLKKARFIILGLSLTLTCLSGGAVASIGPWGGTILNVVVDPRDTHTVYVGTKGGGVFKSTNGGANWSEANVGITNRYILSLALDPSNSSTVYAGTQVGVFKSIDGGKTWSAAGSGLTGPSSHLAIDPNEPQRLYAVGDGIYQSTNGGESWSVVFRWAAGGSVGPLALAPADPRTIYVGASGCFFAHGCTGRLFKSTDRGQTWSQIWYPEGFVTAIAVDPQNSNRVYASNSDLLGSLFRSTDGGAHWYRVLNKRINHLVIHPRNVDIIYAAGNGLFKSTDGGDRWSEISQGHTDWLVRSLAVDPLDSNTVYKGTEREGLFKSTDGGELWFPVNENLANQWVRSVVLDSADANTVYAGTLADGIFKSVNGGQGWFSVSTALSNHGILSLAIDPRNSKTVYAGTDAGGIFKSVDGGERWSKANMGLGDLWVQVQVLSIAPNDSNVLYTSVYNPNRGVYKTTNGGATWSRTGAELNWLVTALAIDPRDSNIVYAGTYDRGVFKSTNGGQDWFPINRGLTMSIIGGLVIDPTDSNTIYAGSSDYRAVGGGVFKSSNGGESWFGINTGLSNRMVLTLALDPKDSKTIYAGSEGGVFKSTDGGASWFERNTGLANRVVSALAVNPRDPSILYAGTDGNSLFVSYDGGMTWDGHDAGGLHVDIPNGDFEALGENGLPTYWQIVWHNAGSGAAFQYDSGGADAFQGNSVLRLHVDPGGGSTFVLSDAIPVAPGATYLISSRMRFNLASGADSVFFSVIQFDHADMEVGFAEVRSRKGENPWRWQPRWLRIRMRPDAVSIRIRFGLVADGESYLDIDAMR